MKRIIKILKNLLFQYTVLSFCITALIASILIILLIDISEDHSVRSHSSFYLQYIESIPTNYPELVPLFSKNNNTTSENHSAQTDHAFKHFLTDLKLFPTLNGVTLYTKSSEKIVKYHSEREMLLPQMENMDNLMDEALAGNFSFHFIRFSNKIILHTFYPIFFEGELLGVAEISDIDEISRFSIEKNNIIIVRIIVIGGFVFYILLFFLFYKVYRSQNIAYKRLDKSQQLTLHSMSLLAELRDHETGLHIVRTSKYCCLIARGLSKIPKYKKYLTDSYINDLERSAPLHDIGKVGIPDHILLKPGKLTVDEFEIIKTHPQMGADVLSTAAESLDFQSFFEIGIQIVLYHHENWDGSGYPKGLSGEDIPLSARIMALADVYDALRSDRPYKKGFSHEKACEIIISDNGIKFDPEIVEVFIEVKSKFEKISFS